MGEDCVRVDQKRVYDEAYRGRQRLRAWLRFDIRHRVRRLHDVAAELGLDLSGRRVFEAGFGGGDLLASMPHCCSVTGAEISRSAVARAAADPRFEVFRERRFVEIPEDDPGRLPDGPFDVVLSAHCLEHVPCDRAALGVLAGRLDPGGLLFAFVPVEEPGYNPDHVRVYTVASFAETVRAAGFEVLHAEGDMQMNGHVWKLLTWPSRRRLPVLGALSNGLRLWSMAPIPYRLFRWLDRTLARLGVGPRQAFVVARRPAGG